MFGIHKQKISNDLDVIRVDKLFQKNTKFFPHNEDWIFDDKKFKIGKNDGIKKLKQKC